MVKPTGRRIVVIDSDTDREIFTGYLADIPPPWWGWHRVIPDQGFIDLPPKYKIREVREHEHGKRAGRD